MTTKIGWVARDGTKAETWNPFVGCSLVSPGCTNCYAMGVAAWIDGMGKTDRYAGTTTEANGRPVWTGVVKRSAPAIFEAPLRWSTPRTVFVNSMSDLFHEAIDPNDLWAVFAIMAASPQHTFQVLTKRPQHMRGLLAIDGGRAVQKMHDALKRIALAGTVALTWPLPNVWLGISTEDQRRADERWPYLRDTPAAIRFISYEPALEAIDFVKAGVLPAAHHHPNNDLSSSKNRSAIGELVRMAYRKAGGVAADWIIVGGESGPRARAFDLAWARSTIRQAQLAGTSVFVKQMGARPVAEAREDLAHLTDKKGENAAEWPEDLRVREWPA